MGRRWPPAVPSVASRSATLLDRSPSSGSKKSQAPGAIFAVEWVRQGPGHRLVSQELGHVRKACVEFQGWTTTISDS